MKEKLNKMREKLKKMFKIGYKQFLDPYYQGFAAQMAFYFLLSIIPLMGVISQVLGLFDISLDYLRELVSQSVKLEVAELLTDYLKSSESNITGIVMAVISLWAASKAQFALVRLTNYTLTDGRTTGRYLRERIRSLLNILVLIFTIVFSLIVLVYGDLILKIIFGPIIEEGGIDTIWQWARWLVAMALYFLMVASNYYILPAEKVPFRKIVPGAIFASIGLLLITWGYSKYMTYVSNYDIIYGSLASIVALLFWFYCIAWVIWIGVLFNKCWIESEVE